jgi:hypothetical protein
LIRVWGLQPEDVCGGREQRMRVKQEAQGEGVAVAAIGMIVRGGKKGRGGS